MLLFDIETDGLLDTVSKVHCLVIKDTETGRLWRCFEGGDKAGHHEIVEGLNWLQSGDTIAGHNIINYDIPVLQKLYPSFSVEKAKVFDTLVAARLIYSNLKDIDSGLLKKGKIPGILFGANKLEAWGYRLGLQKGEYASDFKARLGGDYEEGMEWREFSQEMLDYCVLDVQVTEALYNKLAGKNYSPEALELEHKVAWLMAQQMRNGFPFNKEKGAALYAKLVKRKGELERELKDFFKWWFAPEKRTVSPKDRKVWHKDPMGGQKRRIKEKGRDAYFETGWYEEFTAGVPYTKIKIVEFNPGSRDHIADRLTKLYGWVPEVFTDGGKPKVDEEVMTGLPYPPTALLTEFLLVSKRVSQLAEGDQAWLKVEKNGKIHGSINTNGAVTGRATHAFPNVSQVPAVGSAYGYESRELFGIETIRDHWPEAVQVGADASGLELRCLAHFMAKYDGGKYGHVLLTGDIHWANVQSMGLTNDARDEKGQPLHKVYRDGAKTFIYGFLYGAGDEKVGKIVYGLVLKARSLGLPYEHLLAMFFDGVENPGPEHFKAAGKKLKATFLKKTPALKRLIGAVRESAKRGFLIGLDKRQLHVRSAHAALNTLLQSAGALLCKVWLVILEEELQAKGYKHGWDGDYAFMAWVHDEVQIAARTPEIAKEIAKIAEESVTKAGEHFNFRCPLAGEAKTGSNWAETH